MTSWTKPEHEQWFGPRGYNPEQRIEIHEYKPEDHLRFALSWLSNDNPGDPPKLEAGWYLVQYFEKSPHPESWRSDRYDSADEARKAALILRAQHEKNSGYDPRRVCSNYMHLAFVLHWERVSHSGHPSKALIDCTECCEDAEQYVRDAVQELDWIKEVIRQD